MQAQPPGPASRAHGQNRGARSHGACQRRPTGEGKPVVRAGGGGVLWHGEAVGVRFEVETEPTGAP
jgi:hypothetical protein